MIRAYTRGPGTTYAAAAALVGGGAGAAYPRALLVAPAAPGLLGGLCLGIAGATISTLLWGVPLCASLSGGDDSSGPRAILHVSGRSQFRTRGSELLALLALVGLLSLVGGAGGLASTGAQQVIKNDLDLGLRLSPEAGTFGLCLGIITLSAVLGWILGIAMRNAVIACALYGGAVAITVALAGVSYFAPPFRFAAALSPFGAFLVFMKSELASRQFTGDTPDTLRLIGLVFWTSLLVSAAMRRMAKRVV